MRFMLGAADGRCAVVCTDWRHSQTPLDSFEGVIIAIWVVSHPRSLSRRAGSARRHAPMAQLSTSLMMQAAGSDPGTDKEDALGLREHDARSGG